MSFLDFVKKRKINREHFLVLDIGSEFVKVLAIKNDEKIGRGLVLGTSQVRQNYRNMSYGAVSDINGVIQTCESAISEAEEMAGVRGIEDVVIGIAGEFVKGTTTIVHYERANPQIRIEAPELKNIMQKVQRKAFDQVRKQLAWENNCKEIDIKLVNASIVSVKIDGYTINNPIGFQGKNVSVGIFNAYTPAIHQDALNTIADELDLNLISIVVEPYAVINSLGIESERDFGSIFIDVGGGTTDIALMRNGILEGTVMFSVGGRAFTNCLANDLRLSFDKAEELKIKYSAGVLKKNTSEKLNNLLLENCRIWSTGVIISLESFLSSKNDPLPSRILLCGGGSALPGISKILNSDQLAEKLPFARRPQVSFIQPQDAVYIIDKTKTLKDPQSITPLGLASLIIKSKNNKDNLTQILDRAVKINQR